MAQFSVKLLKHVSKIKSVGEGYSLRIVAEDGKEFTGITDTQGEVFFDAVLVQGKKVKFEFWGKEFPKGVIPITQEKEWAKEKIKVHIKIPLVCELELRESENKNNEPTEYKQAYYLIKSEDTWMSIQRELNLEQRDITLLQFVNELPLDSDIPPPIGKKLKYYRGMKRSKDKSNNKIIHLRSCNTGHPEAIIIDDDAIDFDWFETPIVKLIVSKESKGSYNAYNVTGWDKNGKNKVYASHFEPTSEYYIEKMTIKEIRTAQKNHIGENRKHLFAVGIFQMIPDTLFGKLPTDKYFMKWVKRYLQIDENTQLFDRNFQQLTPLFFWEEKRATIRQYFEGKASVIEAAYAIAQEWASAAVPKGFPVRKKKTEKIGKISDGTISFYDSDGLNKAHYPAVLTIKALEETKMLIDSLGGYEVIRNHTLSIINQEVKK